MFYYVNLFYNQDFLEKHRNLRNVVRCRQRSGRITAMLIRRSLCGILMNELYYSKVSLKFIYLC